MSKEVKRYVATRTLPAASEWNSSTVPHTYVRAADYDALLAERDRLKEALAAMLEIHSVTQRYADTHIEIPQSWVDVSDFARAALQGAQP